MRWLTINLNKYRKVYGASVDEELANHKKFSESTQANLRGIRRKILLTRTLLVTSFIEGHFLILIYMRFALVGSEFQLGIFRDARVLPMPSVEFGLVLIQRGFGCMSVIIEYLTEFNQFFDSANIYLKSASCL